VPAKIVFLIGTVLSCFFPTAAQTAATPAVPGQPRRDSTIRLYRAADLPDRTAFPSPTVAQNPGARLPHVAIRSSTSTILNLQHLAGAERNETLFRSQWRLPLVQFCGGHLEVSAFQSALHMDSIMLGPERGSLRGFVLPRLNRVGGRGSVDLSGFSLSFHLAPGWRPGHVIASRLPHIIRNIVQTSE